MSSLGGGDADHAGVDDASVDVLAGLVGDDGVDGGPQDAADAAGRVGVLATSGGPDSLSGSRNIRVLVQGDGLDLGRV